MRSQKIRETSCRETFGALVTVAVTQRYAARGVAGNPPPLALPCVVHTRYCGSAGNSIDVLLTWVLWGISRMTAALATSTPPVASQPLPHPECIAFAVRAAAEGIPVGAIARTLRMPFDRVLLYLQRAKKLGALIELPKSDWPANQSVSERSRSVAPLAAVVKGPALGPVSGIAALAADEQEFLCRNAFKLTILEAGFLVVLLRCLFAEKEKLHAVIETQRHTRSVRPDRTEPTDPKMVDVMICKLRKKMGAYDPRFIVMTSWGKGYYLTRDVKDIIFQTLETQHAGNPVTSAQLVVEADAAATA